MSRSLPLKVSQGFCAETWLGEITVIV